MQYNSSMKFLIVILILLSVDSFAADCSPAKDTSRITVAGGSITEILYALGAENQIIAVDTTSNFPVQTKNHPSIGYVRNLSAEGVLSLNPTLIIGEDDMGPPAVLEQIGATGVDIEVVEEQHSSQGVIDKINCVASILSKGDIANRYIQEELLPTIKQLEQRIKKPRLAEKALFILSLQSGSPLVAGTETSAHGLIKMIGVTNSMSSFRGWKPASTEAIIAAAPDVILISQRGVSSFGGLDAVKKHPALRLTPAVQKNRVIAMDGMAMLGFGPRTVDSALSLAEMIFTD